MRDDMPRDAVIIDGISSGIDEDGRPCGVVRAHVNFRSPAMLRWMARRLYTEAVERGVPGWHPLLWWGIFRACWFMFWGR